MQYIYTEKRVREAQRRIFQAIDRIYDTERYQTPEDLKGLMEKENILLLQLRQNSYDWLKKGVLEGLREDKMEYPELFWAECLARKIQMLSFTSLRQYAPMEAAKPPCTGGSGSKKTDWTAGGSDIAGKTLVGVGGVGTVVAAATLTSSPIHLMLLALGIVVTAGGCILCIKNKKQGQADLNAQKGSASAVGEQVEKILRTQREECKRLVKSWCDETLEMVGREMEGYGKE